MKLKLPKELIGVEPDFLISIEEIMPMILAMDAKLEEKINMHDLEAISLKLEDLRSWLGRVGDLVASAKWYYQSVYNLKYEEALIKVKKNGMDKVYAGFASPSTLKEYQKSKCADWIWLESKTDRLYSGLVHSIDALRSQMSKQKEVYKAEMFAENASKRGN